MTSTPPAARLALRRRILAASGTLLAEAAAVCVLLLVISLGSVALEHPASLLHQSIEHEGLRRLAMGVLVGAVIVGLTYSPWGQRSGAQLNPAVTLALVRARRMPALALPGYLVAQLVGALAGVALASSLAASHLAHPDIAFANTTFDPGAWPLAFAVEMGLGFALMTLILYCGLSRRWAPRTGLCVGAFVVLFVVAVGPISGVSMNPWRSLVTAMAADDYAHLWLYCLAPPLGTLVAAEIFRRRHLPRDAPQMASPRGFEPLSPP